MPPTAYENIDLIIMLLGEDYWFELVEMERQGRFVEGSILRKHLRFSINQEYRDKPSRG